MARTAELRLRPQDMNGRVLAAERDRLSATRAASALKAFLTREQPGLAASVHVGAEADQVVVTATGEFPEDLLASVADLVSAGHELVADEIAVDPGEFTVEAQPYEEPEPDLHSEVLCSRVRYFPYPEAEWFEISTGLLTLTGRTITYEPEWVMSRDAAGGRADLQEHSLDEIGKVYRGEWWDVPCLMIDTPGRTYRYGWPGARGELDRIFDVGEWLTLLRSMLEG